MVFKRMLGALGVGAPSVDTVLSTPQVRPGGVIAGEVRVKGGEFDADVQRVALDLVAVVEAEHHDGEQTGLAPLCQLEVSGPFRLPQGADRVLPFQMPVPWETPITELQGHHLTGMAVGVRTELAIAKVVDKGDLDVLAVEPLPSQEAVLEAFARLGCRFKSADLELGQLYGVSQTLPCFQEIEFYAPPEYAGRVNEIELTFVATPDGLDVIVEVDKRTGAFGSHDAIGRFHVTHEEALRTDWAAELTGWLNGLGGGHAAYGEPYPGHDHHGYGHGHHGDGPGLGAVALAGAAGVVGGFVAAEIAEEIVEEIFEDDEGDEDW